MISEDGAMFLRTTPCSSICWGSNENLYYLIQQNFENTTNVIFIRCRQPMVVILKMDFRRIWVLERRFVSWVLALLTTG